MGRHRIRHGIACAAACFRGGAAYGEVVYVNGSAPPGGDGSSWAGAFDDLQEALASGAGEVWVATGTYVPGAAAASTFELRSGLALYGGFSGAETGRDQRDSQANPTILSGDVGQDDVYGYPVWYQGWNIHTANSVHVVTAAGADSTAVLDGFTIMAGYSTFETGAGLLVTGGGPTIANCTFWRNLAGFSHGGGLSVQDSAATFTGCAFSENYVHLGQGAGALVTGASPATFTDCTFTANRCVGSGGGSEAAGAGISSHSTLPITVRRCAFDGNQSVSFYPAGDYSGTYGGAIHLFGWGQLATIRECTFDSNFSNSGGALWTWGDVLIVNCAFTNNDAPEYQAQQGGWGGIAGAVGGSAFQPMTITMANCTVAGNSAHAGGGLRVMQTMSADIADCIFWGNTDALGSIGVSQIKGASASYSCIQNFLVGEPGEDPPDPADFPGCIDENPLLLDPASGDVHLRPGSPAIDAGDNAAVPAEIGVDWEGQDRFADDPAAPDTGPGTPPIVDMGADERVPADLDGDGTVDVVDLIALLAAWGPCVSCAEDLDGDGSVSVTDLLALLGEWG